MAFFALSTHICRCEVADECGHKWLSIVVPLSESLYLCKYQFSLMLTYKLLTKNTGIVLLFLPSFLSFPIVNYAFQLECKQSIQRNWERDTKVFE
jgi:hypothetical protein